MKAGTLEIELLANMARLQQDMDKAKGSVSNAVDTMNKLLGAIGVGVSLSGITSLIKGVADTGDKLNDLRKITGLTIEQLGGLGKVAKLNGTDLDSVAKAIGIMSKNMYAGSAAFDTLKISTKDSSGQLRDAGSVLLEISDKFSQMQDGATKSALANQLFGKSGRELIPMLNEGSAVIAEATDAYRQHSGMTLQTAQASDEFNDILTALSGRVTAVKTSFVGELLPTLNLIGNAMLDATKNTGSFSVAAQVVVPVLKGLAIAGYTVVDTFKGMGRELGARAAQLTALAKLDFSAVATIGQALSEDNAKSRAEFDKFVDTVLNGSESVKELADTEKEYLRVERQIPDAVSKTARAMREKKMLTDAEQLALLRVQESTRETIALNQRVAQITESVATEQEIYNQKLEELDRLKPYLSAQTYERALDKLNETTKQTANVTRTTADEVSQLWIQAGRNIQSALGNMVFDFFNNGLKGMVDNVKNTVLRIVSEFAGLKIAQTIGLSSMFAVPGSAAANGGGLGSLLAGGASGGSSGMNLMNLGSMGSSILNLGSSALRTGFGMTGLVGSGLSSLGGASTLGAFGAGMQGGSAGAAFIAAESATAGAGAAASMGATFAAAAGPLMAAFVATQVGRMIAGDKRMSGGFGKAMNAVGDIPILGDFMPVIPLMNALFGRGPLKQKETNLIGDFTGEGFSGITSTKFKAQGGAFRGSKVDRVMIDTDTGNLLNEYKGLVEGGISKVLEPFAREAAVAAMQLGKYLDDVTTSTSTSMSKVAESLGKGKDAMEGFYYGVNIASEKGKSLTDEQISGVLTEMADTMARRVIPNIDEFRKAGESAADAALRIGNEFETLVGASTILGVSLNDARTALLGTSIEGRTAFIEAAGGVDALNSKVQYFAQNFLDGSEIVQRNSELLTEKMGELGLSTSMTKEDFKNLVQSFGQVNGVSEEMLIALLDIAPLFNEVKTAADAAGTSIDNLATKLMLTNQEAVAVGTVMANVGYSFDDIMQVLRDLPAEEITAFVNKVGGIDALLSSSGAFAQNFLTGAELAQTKADYLAKQFADLGIRSNLTAQDFKNLVQGVGEFAGVSLETRAAAAALTGQFVELYGGTNQAAEGTNNLTDAVGELNTVAPGAVASIQQLVTAGLNFGFTMQQVSQMISSSTQDQLNQAITNAGGISKVTQDSQFIKANFMTPERALAIDMQDLANQLVTVGASTQTTRAEFLKLIQTAQVGSQRFNDLNAIAPLFDSVYDRIEAAAQAAANYVPPQPTVINQAQIDAANSALQTAESNLANARQQLASARQQEAGQIQQDIDRFKQLAKTLRDASKALSLSDLSPLTPGEKYNEAARQLNSLQAAAMRGDQDAMSQLPDAAQSFLEASKLYQGQSTTAYQADFSKVQALLDTTAGKAETQLSVAQKQLDALGNINSSTLSVAQAVRDLASAQSVYDAAKSSIPDAIYSTPTQTTPTVPTMPTSGTLLTDINTSSSNVLAFPSDTQILDFVGSHWGDWKGIYDEAQKYKVSSARLASVTAGTQYQLAQSDISAWVQSQGLPAFERGTDMVRRGGLAVLHPAEAVTPANHMLEMAREIRELRREVAELRKDSNRNSSEARRVYIESNRENAIMINDGVKSAGKTENWNNRLRRAVNAGK